jgi:hypothetical protein
MARLITDIQNEIYAKMEGDAILPSSISQSAIYRRFAFIVAYAIWLLETLFDQHKKEVNEIIEAKMPHRPNWYRTKALDFQYGFDLIADTDTYDNEGLTDEIIENSKPIKYAAVTKNGGQILIKIATEAGGVLAPIAPEVKASFGAYIEEIADCGVRYLVVNNPADRLVLGITIYRNPLVLDANGMNIRTAKYPVQDAINEYMKQLPFNGELVLAHLVDALQRVEGVVIPHIYNVTNQAYDTSTEDYLAPDYIDVKTVPSAGYFEVGSLNNAGEFEVGNFSSVNYEV